MACPARPGPRSMGCVTSPPFSTCHAPPSPEPVSVQQGTDLTPPRPLPGPRTRARSPAPERMAGLQPPPSGTGLQHPGDAAGTASRHTAAGRPTPMDSKRPGLRLARLDGEPSVCSVLQGRGARNIVCVQSAARPPGGRHRHVLMAWRGPHRYRGGGGHGSCYRHGPDW
jgi:hypothetical protein